MFTSIEESIFEGSIFEGFSNCMLEEILGQAFTSGCDDSSELKAGVWILGNENGLACELEMEEVRLRIKVILGVRLGLTLVLGIVFDGVSLGLTRWISLRPPLCKPLPEVDPDVIT